MKRSFIWKRLRDQETRLRSEIVSELEYPLRRIFLSFE